MVSAGAAGGVKELGLFRTTFVREFGLGHGAVDHAAEESRVLPTGQVSFPHDLIWLSWRSIETCPRVVCTILLGFRVTHPRIGPRRRAMVTLSNSSHPWPGGNAHGPTPLGRKRAAVDVMSAFHLADGIVRPNGVEDLSPRDRSTENVHFTS